MLSETRYARNGDLRVAYRASREGPRDIVFVSNWFTNCEVFPELPSLQGWVEAVASLGRLIFFDQPGTGASDPVEPGSLPTLEQWADSITAVLDDLGSTEAVLLAIDGSLATAALFAATYPSRTTALVALEGYADAGDRTALVGEEVVAAMAAMWGTGEFQHAMNPDMPWNEQIRAAWARHNRLAASPGIVTLMMPLVAELNARAILPTVRVPTLVIQRTDDPLITRAMGKDVADAPQCRARAPRLQPPPPPFGPGLPTASPLRRRHLYPPMNDSRSPWTNPRGPVTIHRGLPRGAVGPAALELWRRLSHRTPSDAGPLA